MKVSQSEYIKSNKPLFKELTEELLKSYAYVSLLAEDAEGKVYSISKSGINIDAKNDLLSRRGFVVKVYDNGLFA
ncbi:MAG: hypothetical protein J6S95_01640 [Lachnospiraceae bacterium]|nr:hypothetical protein [Lachnospiraceae bacterium]